MKLTNLSILIIFLLFAFACQQVNDGNNNQIITSQDSLDIVNGVTTALDLYSDAHNKLDAERISGFWSNSPRVLFIVNDFKYSNWNTLFEGCKEFYAMPIDSTNLIWLESEIIPITTSFAQVNGKYEMYLRYSSGDIMHAIPYFTALMVREDNTWKVLQGHESYELIK